MGKIKVRQKRTKKKHTEVEKQFLFFLQQSVCQLFTWATLPVNEWRYYSTLAFTLKGHLVVKFDDTLQREQKCQNRRWFATTEQHKRTLSYILFCVQSTGAKHRKYGSTARDVLQQRDPRGGSDSGHSGSSPEDSSGLQRLITSRTIHYFTPTAL